MDDEPIFEVVESRMSPTYKPALRRPMRLRIYAEHIECDVPGVIKRGATETVRYSQISQVVVDQGVFYSGLRVQTLGGGGFVIGNLRKQDSRDAKAAIDEHVAVAFPDTNASTSQPETTIVEQLSQLQQLRDNGTLTDEEFATAKQRILSSG